MIYPTVRPLFKTWVFLMRIILKTVFHLTKCKYKEYDLIYLRMRHHLLSRKPPIGQVDSTDTSFADTFQINDHK